MRLPCQKVSLILLKWKNTLFLKDFESGMNSGIAGRTNFLQGNLLLLGLVLALFLLNFYSKTLFFRPGSIHQWRQTDCLSIAKNYYEEGMHFFEPKIHYQGVKDGKAVSECPLLNYSVATLWKVFGEHEFIYRLLEYIIFLSAIFVLFNTLLYFSRSVVLSLFAASFFLTSPLLAYYSLNFIADVPAFSFGLISFCLFYLFYNNKKIRYFYIALLTGTLAVLIKASALTGLSLLIFFSLADLLNLNRFTRTAKLFTGKILPSVAIAVSLLMITGWYMFALHYNNNNNNNIFLLTILPIWEMEEEQVIRNMKLLFNTLFPVFLNRAMFFLFFVLVIYVIAKFRRLNVFLKYAFVFSGVFFISYILFFFQVFSVHDYYLVNIMIFPVITVVCFSTLVTENSFLYNNKGFARLFLIFTLLFNSFHCAAIYRLRTIEDDKMVFWFPFISEEEKGLAKYLFWDYGNSIKHLEDFGPELRAAGISREEHVLSIPDYSFDISLYLMDQKGYTIARDHLLHDVGIMDPFINKVSYIVLSDTTLKHEPAFLRHENRMELFFTRNHVSVYKVKNGP
jgi:hypothetical protein